MAVTVASAPGKIILFGEHAVVYGRPAIAAPLSQVRAEAIVEDSGLQGIKLRAPDLAVERLLAAAPKNDPFARSVEVVLETARIKNPPNLVITVRSLIPIASGLGSGAAMAAAVIRALSRHLGLTELSKDKEVSKLCYRVEKLLHGTPSGIDNTVVSFEQPVYFTRQEPANIIETFQVATPLRFLVADTGIASSTKGVVGDVRRQWQRNPRKFESLFDGCGHVTSEARSAIQVGDSLEVGRLMNKNHYFLQQMTVSSDPLDSLISAATSAGALGAKLSGAGRGGNMIALVNERYEKRVMDSLVKAGATKVLRTTLA